LNNYIKSLPQDDTLARAVGLEKSQKGGRLLIEVDLAKALLSHKKEWLTIYSYIRDTQKSNNSFIDYDNILRRISQTPDNKSYELLYFWVCHNQLEPADIDYEMKKNELNEIFKMLTDKIAEHYKETIKLLDRCQRRQNYTREWLPQ
jgi:hypothetical protein